MKRFGIVAGIFLVVCLFFTCVRAQADGVPQLINYQGYLTDKDGAPLATAEYKLLISIYTVPTGGTAAWGPQVFTNVPVVRGYFNVILVPVDAQVTPRPITSAFLSDKAYLEISVNGSAISPRQQILSTPYALKAETVQGTNLYVDSTSGKVGIGTSSPGELLDVAGVARVGYLWVKAQDNNTEGGEVRLDGNNFPTWALDNWNGNIRLHHDGNVFMNLDPKGILAAAGGVTFPDGKTQTTAARILKGTVLVTHNNTQDASEYVNFQSNFFQEQPMVLLSLYENQSFTAGAYEVSKNGFRIRSRFVPSQNVTIAVRYYWMAIEF